MADSPGCSNPTDASEPSDPIAQFATNLDPWDCINTWLASMCFVVGCDLQSQTSPEDQTLPKDLHAQAFVIAYELTAGLRFFTPDERKAAILASKQILQILSAHPDLMEPELEKSLRFTLSDLLWRLGA